jgi:hypothetical protein
VEKSHGHMHPAQGFGLLLLCLTWNPIAQAGEPCGSKIGVFGDCVPSEIVAQALADSTPGTFLDTVRAIYTNGAAALGMKRTPIYDADEAPGYMLVSENSGFPGKFLGRDFDIPRPGQYDLISSFCSKHGGTVKSAPIAKTTVAICIDDGGKALAALTTRNGRTSLNLDTVLGYYYSAALAQSFLDFRVGIKPGDKSHLGMVTDVRGAIAKIQKPGGGEEWVEIEKLVPATAPFRVIVR